jgi:cell division protein FtsN
MIPKAGYCQIAPAKETSPGQKGRFSVQVGSFKSRENAEKLNHKLAGDGYDSFVDYPAASLDGMYRVKIGRFTWKSEADSAAAKLRNHGYNTRICSGNACQ